jgi:hypothetical protein
MPMQDGLPGPVALESTTDAMSSPIDAHPGSGPERTGPDSAPSVRALRHAPMQTGHEGEDLSRLEGFARELCGLARGGLQTRNAAVALRSAASGAGEVLARASTSPSQLLRALSDLRATTAAFVRAVFRDGEAAVQERVQRAQQARLREQVLRARIGSSRVQAGGTAPMKQSKDPLPIDARV